MIGKPTRGTSPDVPKAIELYKQGYSINKIGEMLGHHHSIIAYHLYKNNIPIRTDHLRFPKITTEYIRQLYDEGLSTTEIGEKVGLTAQAIYGRLLKAKIPLRGLSESIRLAHKRGRISCRGEKNPLWKGGRSIDRKGYIALRVDGKQLLEHRYIWERTHGVLPSNWVVHHLNGIRTDNRIENLYALARNRHSPNEIIKPHQERIRILEAELKQCKQHLQANMFTKEIYAT